MTISRKLALLIAMSILSTLATLTLSADDAYACTPGSKASGTGGMTITCPTNGASSGSHTTNPGHSTHPAMHGPSAKKAYAKWSKAHRTYAGWKHYHRGYVKHHSSRASHKAWKHYRKTHNRKWWTKHVWRHRR